MFDSGWADGAVRPADPRGLITHTTLSAFLSRYGLLRSLRNLGSDSWEAEWYDERDCEAAVAWLVSREFTDFSVAVTTGVADEEVSVLRNMV